MVAGSQIAIPFLVIYIGGFLYFLLRGNGDGK